MATLTSAVTPDIGRSTARTLHPLAWWSWALCLAVVATLTTNPLVLGLLGAVVSLVVAARRQRAPWAAAFRYAVITAAIIVVARVAFRIVFGGGLGVHVLVPLPAIPLTGAEGGVTLFGDITAEALLGGFYDGLRLAAVVLAVGAASALANPRRLLRSLPTSLHEVGTALVVAVSVFPQLIESIARVRVARRIRPAAPAGRVERLRSVVVPVLEDSLERSIQLAASMDARGYGRVGHGPTVRSRASAVMSLAGLVILGVGVYATADATTPRWMATPMILLGVIVAVAGGLLGGTGVVRTAYRPDRWRVAESLTALSGLGSLLITLVVRAHDPGSLHTAASPPEWPVLPWALTVAVLVAALPAVATPHPDEEPVT